MWRDDPWLVTSLNVLGWPILHLAWGYLFTRMPSRWFQGLSKNPWLFDFEKHDSHWAKLRLRRWKSWLPDGAAWFGGFPKKKLKSTDLEYLNQFMIETHRSELSHWVMLLSGGVFLLWNPPWAIVVMLGFGVLTNLPPILVQRFNRFRFDRMIRERKA